jgi:hypothetical protein
MAFYPTIRDETAVALNAVLQNIQLDASYLDKPECPYSPAIKSFFKSRIETSSGPEIDIFAGEDELIVLDSQIIKVINDLEKFGNTLTSEDVTEKMAYFRTKTSLIEKLVTMRERLANLKEISDFRSIILGFMNETCTKDQITDLMHRLDGVLGTKNDNIS